MVGNIQLDEEAKRAFLKQLILTRITKLATKLQEVRQTATTRPGDCIYRAAELLLVGFSRRLDYLRGQVRLWD